MGLFFLAQNSFLTLFPTRKVQKRRERGGVLSLWVARIALRSFRLDAIPACRQGSYGYRQDPGARLPVLALSALPSWFLAASILCQASSRQPRFGCLAHLSAFPRLTLPHPIRLPLHAWSSPLQKLIVCPAIAPGHRPPSMPLSPSSRPKTKTRRWDSCPPRS